MSYAYRNAVRNTWRVKREKGANRYGVLYDIPYRCQVVQRAICEHLDVGSVDPSADNVPDRLVES